MKRIASIGLLLLGAFFSMHTLAAEVPKQAAWPMRYVIFIDIERWYKAGLENWHDNPKKKAWMEGFFPAYFAKAPGAKERLAAMHIDFDKQGKVISKTLSDIPLLGYLTKHKALQLSTPEGFTPAWEVKPFVYLESYESHLPAEEPEWNTSRMTLCTYDERTRMQAELLAEEDGPAFNYKLKPEEGIFYCNDWSKQLANPNRPWIDVTSYEKRGPRVRKFQGYGLFGVTKPVVGKHYKTWICFADCPDGKPGPIADIKAWSKQYDLPVENLKFGLE